MNATISAEKQDAVPPPSLTSKPSVLLVEDYKANVLVAGTLLETFGYTYEAVANGQEALSKLESKHFDIILMDVNMPGMDGYETTRRIREKEKQTTSPRTLIIAMTAHAQPQDRQRCLNEGMDDYISKPFNPVTLQEKLSNFGK